MIIKKIISCTAVKGLMAVFFIFVLFSGFASAVVYEDLVVNPLGLGYYSPTIMLTVESHATAGEISVFDPAGAGVLTAKIYDLPFPEDAQIGPDGLIYFVLRDGRVFQCTDSGYKSFIDDYSTCFVLLDDLDALTQDRGLVVDSSGNVYVNSDDEVYIFTAPSLSSSIFSELSVTITHEYAQTLGLHKDGILVGVEEIGTTLPYAEELILVDWGGTPTSIYEGNTATSSRGYFGGVYSTITGDIYFSRGDNLAGSYISKLDYADSYSISNIADTTHDYDSDVYIDINGVIYVSDETDDVITTYSTTDLSGGYTGGIVGEIEGSYVNWDSDTYYLGDTASYTFGWDMDDRSILTRDLVVIIKDGVVIDRISAGVSGTRYLDISEMGHYSVSLISYGLLTYNNPVVYATDGMDCVEIVDSFVNVPQEAASKSNFTVTYMSGPTPVSLVLNVKELQNDYRYKIIDTQVLPSALAGVTYTTNMSISTVGYYVIELYDNGLGESLATDSIYTNFVYVPPTDVISSSYIDTTDFNFSFGGVISGFYGVDDQNYSDYYINLEVYNLDQGLMSFSVPVLHQIDSFDIPVSEFDIYNDGETLHVVETNFLSGLNSVRVSAYNITGGLVSVLDSVNVTITNVDDSGYGLRLSNNVVNEMDMFAIIAISPTSAVVRIHPVSLMGVDDDLVNISGSTQFMHMIGSADHYRITLEVDGEVMSAQMLQVLPADVVEDVEEVDSDIDVDSNDISSNFKTTVYTMFGTSPTTLFIVGVFISAFCGVGFGMATRHVAGGVIGAILGLGIAVSLSFISMVWAVLVVIIAGAVVAVVFKGGVG